MTIGGASASLTNCILWGNGTDQVSLLDYSQTGSSLSVRHCDIENGQTAISVASMSQLNWNEGNINADPLFLGSGDHPYSLTTASPCIDAGTPETATLPLPDGDLSGRTRIWDGDENGSSLIDIGPYEFGSPPVGINRSFIHLNTDPAVSVYPNPCRHSATIAFHLDRYAGTIICIYDGTGRLVHRMEENLPAGSREWVWTPGKLPPGMYYYLLRTGTKMASGRIELIR
jgi:hypothetical protein